MTQPGSNFVSATIRRGLFTRVVGRRVLYYPVLGSTMDEAARLAKEGAIDGTVVVAEVQERGRGRFGRNWVSSRGNIYLSVIFRPSLQDLPLLSIIGGVATVQTIRKTTGLDPQIKWPNDVILGGLKAAGILVESVIEGESLCYAVLGIGLNVALDPAENEETAGLATSLERAAERPISLEEVLGQLLLNLDSAYLKMQQGQSPMDQWRGMLTTLGQKVRVSWRGGETHTGLTEDIDSLGNLLLRLDDGSLVTVTAGDVSLAS